MRLKEINLYIRKISRANMLKHVVNDEVITSITRRRKSFRHTLEDRTQPQANECNKVSLF